MTPKITLAGLNTLLRGIAGDSIHFVSVKLGNGAEQEADTAIDLSNPLMELPLSGEVLVNDNYAQISTTFSNAEVEAGFRLKELGIFVQDPEDETRKILYAYGYDEDAVADYIAAKTDRIIETKLDYMIFVGSAENVTAAINSSLVYASADDLKAHTEDRNNPHGVTAEDIGLGYVKNLAPGDLEIEFETPAQLTDNITSGEKLSSVLGKVRASIRTIMDHVRDKGNPHNVTAKGIGAALDSHEHTATDITSGILLPVRGGTGVTSPTAGGILKANGQSAMSVLRGKGALFAETVGNPQFDTLPASVGGTGVSSPTAGGILKTNGQSAMTVLRGKGALYAASAGSPQFGTLPVSVGGTGLTALEGTDYSTRRVRAIGLASITPSSVPSGTIVLVYA